MKTFLSVAVLMLGLSLVSQTLVAQTLSQPLFQIDLEEGWNHSTQKGTTADGSGAIISIHHPERGVSLKIQSFEAPATVRRDRLREMTNVDWSEQLDWESWGACAGDQCIYSEEGLFYRQWWLANESTVVFFVYSARVQTTQSEQQEINRIVRSIASN